MEAALAYMWDPVLPLTPDGAPLATKIAHLLPSSFPQDRNVGPAEMLLRPDVVLYITAAYLAISVLCVKVGVERFKVNDEGWPFKGCMALHNFLLVVFSGITCLRSWTIVAEQVGRNGYLAT